MDLSLGLENTHVIVTGGAGYIGSKIVEAFLSAGALVTSIDKSYLQHHYLRENGHLLEMRADIAHEESLIEAWQHAVDLYKKIPTCVIACAGLDLSVLKHHETSAMMPLQQFRRTMEVNVLGSFATSQLWLRGLDNHRALCERIPELGRQRLENVGLVFIGSESGHWGERSNADYAASKAAIQYGLLPSLAQDAPRIYPGARVNVVAPGPVNTPQFQRECAANPAQYYDDCQGTTALGRPVEVEQVARAVLFLASERWSGGVTGQILNVDSGKVGKVVWQRGELPGPRPPSSSGRREAGQGGPSPGRSGGHPT